MRTVIAFPYIVRYVFLDRDGVLNRKLPEGAYVTNWEQFVWLPGAIEAISRMHRAGLTLILVTNQRGIALGLMTVEDLEQIHTNMQADLARHGARLDAIYYCPHDRGECNCRKPGTGMFEQAMKAFPEIHAKNSVLIGDSISDIEAGRALGMRTIFIEGNSAPANLADAKARSLFEAVDFLPPGGDG